MMMEFLLFLSLYFGRNLQEVFVDNSRFINDSHYEFGKMFVTRIALSLAVGACNDFCVFL